MIKDSIFINIAAYNEDDVLNTVATAFEKAENPDNIFIGITLQYPNENFPDLNNFKNVKTIKVTDKVGLGLGTARGLSSSMYNDEEYYFQIDAHTVFKTNWDHILKDRYKKLKKIAEKPIISTYVPHYYIDKDTGKRLTMAKDENWESYYSPWSLVSKSDDRALGMETEEEYLNFAYNIEALDSPSHAISNFIDWGYQEHHLVSGHFLFTSGNFVKEIKYDPQLAYHEENAIALISWTRGYRIFSTSDHVIWTRGMYAGKDTPQSWRSTYVEKDKNGVSFRDKVIAGTLRNKDILTGKVIGEYGAPTLELLNKYELASGLNYKKFYSVMYDIVEKTGSKYFAAKQLYDLDRKING